MLVNGKHALPSGKSSRENINISEIKKEVDKYLSNMLFDKNCIKVSSDENDEMKMNVDIVIPFPAPSSINMTLVVTPPPKLEKEGYKIEFVNSKFKLGIKTRSITLSHKSLLDFILKYYSQDYYDVEEFIYSNI
ncbi:MAG: hypothetical protein K9H48_07665 [Melioribacteraceae bacterium]|nr:hypothetical protein [Melioribacteraceae bacterium]